jgi:hypothetical protein
MPPLLNGQRYFLEIAKQGILFTRLFGAMAHSCRATIFEWF